MNKEKFLGIIQQQGSLESAEQSERVAHAALLTLSESLYGYEAQNIALYLPEELRGSLRRSAENKRLDREVFLERFSDRAGLSPEHSMQAVRAVFAALREALPSQEVENLQAQIPNDYSHFIQFTGESAIEKGSHTG